jgi:universal stress protein E
MEYFRNILVGVDMSRAETASVESLSAPTQSAIERAIWVAGQVRAELTFFSAIDLAWPHREWLNESGLDTLHAAVQSVLDELVAKAESEGITAHAQFAQGNAAEEIIKQVHQNQHDLVIVGTRDAGSWSRLLYGSTGLRLLRLCPCPVWVTKPGANWEDLEILVASDLSEVSFDAIDLGVRSARMIGARLRVVHALEHHLDRRLRHAGLRDEELDSYYKTLRQDAERRLNEQIFRTDFRTVQKGVIAEVKDGPADRVLLETIETHHIDLIVMGTIARRGLLGVLVGNTAEKLLPQLPCAILAIKPRDFGDSGT